jgi:hypothetical protein
MQNGHVLTAVMLTTSIFALIVGKGKGNNMDLPDSMIHQSFRYVLGRMTLAVCVWCNWAVANWDKIPNSEKAIIERELDEVFDMDDNARRTCRSDFLPLGHDCDRQQWERVRAMYRNNQKNEKVKA